MTDIIHFDKLTESERVAAISLKLNLQDGTYDRNFAGRCISVMNYDQRRAFVKNMDIKVAQLTYPPNCTSEQASDPEIVSTFFLTYANPPLDILMLCVWGAAMNYRL